MIRLGASAKERLQRELMSLIPKMLDAMMPRLERVASGVRRWEAKSKKRTWPLGPMTSSVRIPFVPIIYDSIKARGMNSFLSQDRDINISAINEDAIPGLVDPDTGKPLTWFDVANALEQYLLFEYSSSGQVPYRDFVESLWDEGAMTGTAVPSVSWESFTEFDFPLGATSMKQAMRAFKQDNLCLEVIPAENLLFPTGYVDPRMRRWPIVSHRFMLRPSEIRDRVEVAGWDADAVNEFLTSAPSENVFEAILDEHDSMFNEFAELWLCESWMRFPLDGKNEYKIVVTHALDRPELIFNVSGWPYAHGRSKFSRAFRYIKRRNKFLGMGIPERLEGIDEALSTVINQIIDAGTIANVPIWSVDENVPGVHDIRDLYPGAVVKRGDDMNAIMPLKNLGPGPDIFEITNVLRDFGERLAHVSDYSLGRESMQIGKEGTATGILALLRETGSYFDSIIRDGRDTLDDVNWMALMLIAQQKPIRRMAEVMSPKKAQVILAAMSLRPSDLNKKLSIRVASSNAAATAEIARQEEQAKFILMQQYYERLIVLADSVVQRPYLLGLAGQIAEDANRRVRKLLESYSDSTSAQTLPDFSRFLPEYRKYAMQQQAMALLGEGGEEEDGSDGDEAAA